MRFCFADAELLYQSTFYAARRPGLGHLPSTTVPSRTARSFERCGNAKRAGVPVILSYKVTERDSQVSFLAEYLASAAHSCSP